MGTFRDSLSQLLARLLGPSETEKLKREIKQLDCEISKQETLQAEIRETIRIKQDLLQKLNRELKATRGDSRLAIETEIKGVLEELDQAKEWTEVVASNLSVLRLTRNKKQSLILGQIPITPDIVADVRDELKQARDERKELEKEREKLRGSRYTGEEPGVLESKDESRSVQDGNRHQTEMSEEVKRRVRETLGEEE